MKTIIVTFRSEEWHGDHVSRYLNVTDDFNMFGTFVDNFEYENMKHRQGYTEHHSPMSGLLADEYGKSVYNYAERRGMECPWIQISEQKIEFLPKN